MKNYVNKFAMFIALSCGIALAQGMPQSPQSPQTAPSSPSASPSQTDQSAPSTPSSPQSSPDQAQPQSNPEGKGSPDAMPKSDQGMSRDQNKSDQSSKMPQSDTAAASSDVQSQIQTALQQDPKLANANITVTVSGNKLELNGTVPSNDEKKQAEQIAKSHAGNLKVKNHIKIASANLPGQDKDKDKDKMAPPKQ